MSKPITIPGNRVILFSDSDEEEELTFFSPSMATYNSKHGWRRKSKSVSWSESNMVYSFEKYLPSPQDNEIITEREQEVNQPKMKRLSKSVLRLFSGIKERTDQIRS